MQKKVALLIVAGTLALTLIVAFLIILKPEGKKSKDPFTPQPTSRPSKHEEGEGQKKDRETFFALMHRAAPGIEYQKMDNMLRKEKMLDRNAILPSSSGFRAEEYDTLANGFAIGLWNETGSYNTAGRIWATEIDFPTNTVYAFSDGGNLWKGNLAGSSWAITNDNFKIANTSFLRKINDRLIVATAQWGVQGVYYSEDEGVTWTETTGMDNVAEYGYIFDAVMLNDSLHTMYVLAYNWDYTNWNAIMSLYASTDLGESFTEIVNWDEPTFGGSGKFNIWCARDGSDTAYLIENDNFYSLLEDGTPNYISTIPFTAEGDAVLCGYENGSDKRFYVAVYNWDESTSKIYT
ncbi:MAG: exo-alpha-sialidase [Chitinophagales bacterium]|nr:exo-alpha-sialidase [Chitinophagales bacterium]